MHHEHGPDREVGRDDAADAGLQAGFLERVDPIGRDAGRADDRRRTYFYRGRCVLQRDRWMREVDQDVGLPLAQVGAGVGSAMETTEVFDVGRRFERRLQLTPDFPGASREDYLD
jgi:hypothetical protein